LAIGSSGSLLKMCEKSKRYGYYFYPENVVDIKPVKTEPQSELGRLLKLYKKAKRVWIKAHPNLWKDYAEGYKNITDQEIELFLFAHAGDSYLYERFKEFLSSKGCETYSLFYGVKVVYLSSLKPTRGGWDEYEKMMKELKYNLDNKIDCEYHWQGFYDYSLYINFEHSEPGYGRRYLSCEYRGCGNGHYYCLVNEKMAIHVEDD
jgi:transposase